MPARRPWYTVLYLQVLIAIVAGVWLFLSHNRRCPEAAGRWLHSAHKNDDRAGDLLHDSAWDRYHGRP